ncbi:hypothetical protein [Natrinema sp. SYSU A 869]|uniref:hypothetical protein n=1 Tax=Natrinema sp. SYSU A 869 TaxID=2871694 RepID=UPI001CA45E86|nr:hypothetical protein [Natrinema sp. SYSU A 869]
MTQTETSETGDDAGVRTVQNSSRIGREYASRTLEYARGGVGSGIPVGVGGGVSLLAGVRSVRRGNSERGFGRLALGGVLVAIALAQRRSAGERADGRTGIDQTDVVSTGPDIDDLERRDAGGSQHASSDEAREIAGTAIDIEGAVDTEDVDSSPEPESDVDAAGIDQTDVAGSGPDEERLADAAAESAGSETESEAAEREPSAAEPESYERLGAAAFDEHSSEIPVPQRAFNRNILSLRSEVFWGIRDDDAVFVSQQFDPIQDGDGIRYVASTEIDGDRSLTIPDAVLNHWDTVAGGGMAVASGNDITFLTTDSLQADSQVRLVPEQWLDDVLADED